MRSARVESRVIRTRLGFVAADAGALQRTIPRASRVVRTVIRRRMKLSVMRGLGLAKSGIRWKPCFQLDLLPHAGDNLVTAELTVSSLVNPGILVAASLERRYDPVKAAN